MTTPYPKYVPGPLSTSVPPMEALPPSAPQYDVEIAEGAGLGGGAGGVKGGGDGVEKVDGGGVGAGVGAGVGDGDGEGVGAAVGAGVGAGVGIARRLPTSVSRRRRCWG